MAASAKSFLKFVDSSPSPFHTVHSVKAELTSAGFEQLKEGENWGSKVNPGGKYFVTRNGSSIVAFAVGIQWKPGNPVSMIGAHTDSPCLRIKPVSKKENEGFIQVGVECYGGAIWHTWFDRDLGLAGRVIVKSDDGKYHQKLINIDRPILRVPTLAIHLDRSESFSINKETQLYPIAGLVAAELNRTKDSDQSDTTKKDEKSDFHPLKTITERHHPYLLELIAKEVTTKEHTVAVHNIADFELVLFDTQKAAIGGLNDELIFAARLDNLEMTYCATIGLINSVRPPSSLRSEQCIRLISLFDHEEIGSQSAQGAKSNLLPVVLKRLTALDYSSEKSYDNMESDTAYEQTLATSFLVSADMAHSVHPNYPQKYEMNHRPEMNKGTVIKVNANSRYATNTPGIVLLEEVARRAKSKDSGKSGVPLQLFVVRNDSSCGSTIGPSLAASLGTRTLDLGNPQLSMHSIRETGGVYDVDYAIRLFESFFEHYAELEQRLFRGLEDTALNELNLDEKHE